MLEARINDQLRSVDEPAKRFKLFLAVGGGALVLGVLIAVVMVLLK